MVTHALMITITMTAAAVRLLLVLGLCCPSFSFSSRIQQNFPLKSQFAVTSPLFRTHHLSGSSASLVVITRLRGGNQLESAEIKQDNIVSQEKREGSIPTVEVQQPETLLSVSFAPMASKLASLGTAYGASLEKRPIATKSVTACAIFALSDWLAQRLEKSESKKSTNWTRTISSSLVGLLYFGPAAHAWYDMIFKLLPGTSLVSTLQKAALGQLLFGPSFTCIFFATSLLQQGNFSFQNWIAKIKDDLPGAWVAGLGFWPLVDLVSYSLIPKDWIPLFVNACSLVWTIYLSIVANRQSNVVEHKD
jgi:protein Mpv17